MARQTEGTGQAVATLTPQQEELIERLGVTFVDSDQAALDIASELANAESVEELLGDRQGASWGDFINIPLRVKSVRYMRSGFGDGAGYFAVVNAATADTDEPLTLTTGSVNVLIQLAKLEQFGKLHETPLKLTESQKASANGFRPQRLAFAL